MILIKDNSIPKEGLKLRKLKIKSQQYFGYKSEIDFAIETLPDENLKETIKECNRNGVRVKGFFTTIDPSELASIALRITKENEQRIFNILKGLEECNCVKIILSYNERENMELVRIYATMKNKVMVFKNIQNSVKKKNEFHLLSASLQEVYRMHKLLSQEDMEHQLEYHEGKMFESISIRNIESYFSYGADRVKQIFHSMMQFSDYDAKESYQYKFRDKNRMFLKIRNLNEALSKEFQMQEEQFEALCAKYRRDPEDENSNMFVRLAKIRDEHML